MVVVLDRHYWITWRSFFRFTCRLRYLLACIFGRVRDIWYLWRRILLLLVLFQQDCLLLLRTNMVHDVVFIEIVRGFHAFFLQSRLGLNHVLLAILRFSILDLLYVVLLFNLIIDFILLLRLNVVQYIVFGILVSSLLLVLSARHIIRTLDVKNKLLTHFLLGCQLILGVDRRVVAPCPLILLLLLVSYPR